MKRDTVGRAQRQTPVLQTPALAQLNPDLEGISQKTQGDVCSEGHSEGMTSEDTGHRI